MNAIFDVAYVLGLVAVAVGAGLMFFPAGLIVGGVCVAGTAFVVRSRSA